MKPSETANQAVATISMVRSDGDINTILANTLLAVVRKEISATDANAIVGITDGMCNVMNTSMKAMRLKMEMQKAAGEKVRVLRLGQQLFTGEGE